MYIYTYIYIYTCIYIYISFHTQVDLSSNIGSQQGAQELLPGLQNTHSTEADYLHPAQTST